MAQQKTEILKSIAELHSIPCSSPYREELYTLIAIVDGVDEPGGWCETSCSQCGKGLKVSNGSFWCAICHGMVQYPVIRYRVQVRVLDETGHGVLAMFNQQMERMLDSCANKLMNRIGIGSTVIPTEFRSLIGRIFNFTIKLADYLNPDFDYHHHRVVRVTEVYPVTPIVAAIDHFNKCARKKTIAAFPDQGKHRGWNRKRKSDATGESSSTPNCWCA